MKYRFLIFLFIAACMVTRQSFSQGFHTSSNKALKVYNEGVTAFDFLDYNKAESDFKKAISLDDRFYEAYLMLGELMAKRNRYSEAASNYKLAVEIDSLFYKLVFHFRLIDLAHKHLLE